MLLFTLLLEASTTFLFVQPNSNFFRIVVVLLIVTNVVGVFVTFLMYTTGVEVRGREYEEGEIICSVCGRVPHVVASLSANLFILSTLLYVLQLYPNASSFPSFVRFFFFLPHPTTLSLQPTTTNNNTKTTAIKQVRREGERRKERRGGERGRKRGRLTKRK